MIDKLLADQARFPKRPSTDDQQRALDVKALIAAVTDSQRAALNTIANALDAEDLGRMQNDFPDAVNSINGNARGPDVDGSFIGVSGLIMPQRSTPEPRARGTSNTRGHSVWDRLATSLETQQSVIAGAEERLTPAVVALSVACRDELAPAPAPTTKP